MKRNRLRTNTALGDGGRTQTSLHTSTLSWFSFSKSVYGRRQASIIFYFLVQPRQHQPGRIHFHLWPLSGQSVSTSSSSFGGMPCSVSGADRYNGNMDRLPSRPPIIWRIRTHQTATSIWRDKEDLRYGSSTRYASVANPVIRQAVPALPDWRRPHFALLRLTSYGGHPHGPVSPVPCVIPKTKSTSSAKDILVCLLRPVAIQAIVLTILSSGYGFFHAGWPANLGVCAPIADTCIY